MDYSFTRYLEAKRSVDDRALNGFVRRTLFASLPAGPLDVLEVGAGTGAMLDRLAGDGALRAGGVYTGVDADATSIDEARRRTSGARLPFAVEWETADVHAFARRQHGRRDWDLLVAHAFLDLMDIPRLLPELFALLRPGGHFYFTLNFDGLTVLEPPVDPNFDARVIAAYHRTMDERRIDGRPTGGSHSGRMLLAHLPDAGGEVLAAGASDWVVWPTRGRYPGDEAYFLRHILHFFETSLTGRPELDQARLAGWLARRRAQIDGGELTLIVHQLDVCGRVAGAAG